MDELVWKLGTGLPIDDVVRFLSRSATKLAAWEGSGCNPPTLHPGWCLLERPLSAQDALRCPAEADAEWWQVEQVGISMCIAPEYVKYGAWDMRSAIFSLGCIAWLLLTGRSPFVEESVLETMTRSPDKPIANVATVRQDVPVKLGRIIERAVSLEPRDRHQTIEALVEELEAL